MFSSEQKFEINGEGKEQLTLVLKFGEALSGQKIKGYEVQDDKIILHSQADEPNITPVPPFFSLNTLSGILEDTLSSPDMANKYRAANKPLNIDGGLELGWAVKSANSWHIYTWTALMVVSPDWIYYAK